MTCVLNDPDASSTGSAGGPASAGSSDDEGGARERDAPGNRVGFSSDSGAALTVALSAPAWETVTV